MRKPRPDSKLFSLTPEQQALIAEWLQKESYADVAKRIHMDFGIRVQPSSLSSFWQRICQARLEERLRASARQADDVASVFRETNANWDAAIIGQIKQKIFDFGATDKLTEKQLTGLLITYSELEKVRVREEAVKVLREKLEFDLRKYRDHVAAQREKMQNAISKARDGGITVETISKIEEALNLL